MASELSKAQLQRISGAVASYRHKEVEQLIEWVELEKVAETEMDLDGGTSDKVYEILKTVNVVRRRKIIQHLINEEAPLRIDVLESLEDALQGSDLELAEARI